MHERARSSAARFFCTDTAAVAGAGAEMLNFKIFRHASIQNSKPQTPGRQTHANAIEHVGSKCGCRHESALSAV